MRNKDRETIEELVKRVSKLENEVYTPLNADVDVGRYRRLSISPKRFCLLILDYLKLELICIEEKETIKLKKMKKDKCKQ